MVSGTSAINRIVLLNLESVGLLSGVNLDKWFKSNGYSVRGEYWDVESGSKDTMDRPEFMRMISDSERMGIRVLVFSDQSRLSRDIIVQESTFRLLSSRGYSLVSSENPESFIEDSPTSNLIRQILGSVSEFESFKTLCNRNIIPSIHSKIGEIV